MEKLYDRAVIALCSAIVALVVYLWTRTVRAIDKIEERTDDHEQRLSTLEGEHNVMACKKRKNVKNSKGL